MHALPCTHRIHRRFYAGKSGDDCRKWMHRTADWRQGELPVELRRRKASLTLCRPPHCRLNWGRDPWLHYHYWACRQLFPGFVQRSMDSLEYFCRRGAGFAGAPLQVALAATAYMCIERVSARVASRRALGSGKVATSVSAVDLRSEWP